MTTTPTAVLSRAAAGIRGDRSADGFALAVADWLAACAANADRIPGHEEHHALAVARTYLGERVES